MSTPSNNPSPGKSKPPDPGKPKDFDLLKAIESLQETMRGLPMGLSEVFMRRATSGPSDLARPTTGATGASSEATGTTESILDALTKFPSQIASAFRSSRSTDGGSGHPFGEPPSRSDIAAQFVGPPRPRRLDPFVDPASPPEPTTHPWSYSAFGSAPQPPKPSTFSAFGAFTRSQASQFNAFGAHVNPFVGPPTPNKPTSSTPFDAFKSHANPFVGPPAPPSPNPFSAFGSQSNAKSSPFSAFGPHVQPVNPFSAFNVTPPVSAPSGGWQYGAFRPQPPNPFVGPPTPAQTAYVGPSSRADIAAQKAAQLVGPPAPRTSWWSQASASAVKTHGAGIRGGFSPGQLFGAAAGRAGKMFTPLGVSPAMTGSAVGAASSGVVSAFTSLSTATGKLTSVFGVGTTIVGKAIDLAENTNDKNRRFQGFNPAISMGYSRLAMGDLTRTFTEGRANEKSIVRLTDSINSMRQAYLPFDIAKTGVATRLGSMGAEIGRIAGRDLVAPVADWVNRRLELNDPNGDLLQRAVRWPQASFAGWIAGMLPAAWGGGPQAAAIARQQLMNPNPAPQMDNAWGASLWEMKNPPLSLNPPMKRQAPAPLPHGFRFGNP